jgi:hypothetical protein
LLAGIAKRTTPECAEDSVANAIHAKRVKLGSYTAPTLRGVKRGTISQILGCGSKLIEWEYVIMCEPLVSQVLGLTVFRTAYANPWITYV